MSAHLSPIGPWDYGFKMVDADNLLDPDTLMLQLATVENGVSRQTAPTDLLVPLLRIALDHPVPKEVRSAFFFARNAMCYAYWYYPLLTLASQQVLRVADLALRMAGEANGLTPHRNFGPRIAQLRAAGVVEAEREDRWNLILRMRNKATHPEWQQTWGIPETVDVVRKVAEEISALAWPDTETRDDAFTSRLSFVHLQPVD